MKLNSLVILNYRLFSHCVINFHPELTVIVAPNGGGKTAILDAIKVAFGPYLSTFPMGKNSGIENDDIHLIKTLPELGRMADVLPVAISATGVLKSSQTSLWHRERVSRKGKTTVKDAKQLALYGKSLQLNETKIASPENWPLLAYYGTGRLWNQLNLTGRKIFNSGFHSRSAGYLDCMEPASSYKFFMDWFRYVTRSDNQLKLRFIEKNPKATAEEISAFKGPFSVLLGAVKQAVNTVLTPMKWGNLEFSETLETATIEHPEFGVLTVNQMSDGIRNSLALTADIAKRCVELNAHLGEKVVVETEGIVLIDEVDMHLHPEWQQQILCSLREAFPKIQFIVTTHSPQVLTTVHCECIRMLKVEKGVVVAVTPAHETYAQESRTTLEDVFDVHSRPPLEINKKLHKYLNLVESEEDTSTTAFSLRQELETVLGDGDPQLQLADMLIARNAARRRGRGA